MNKTAAVLSFAFCLHAALLLAQQCVPNANQSCTPNVSLALPSGSPVNWDAALNQNFQRLDSLLSGKAMLPALNAASTNNVLTPFAYGAKGDGATDDTAAFQAALNGAMSTHKALFIPPGYVFKVSQINAADQNNLISIYGDASPTGFQSTISCNENARNTGICLDLTGSQYVRIEGIRFQYGGNYPLAVIRMGKSAGGNGNRGNS